MICVIFPRWKIKADATPRCDRAKKSVSVGEIGANHRDAIGGLNDLCKFL